MEKIAILYAQKLIEDLMESSSSSDEDDEMFAVLKGIEETKAGDKTTVPEETSNEDKVTEAIEIVQPPAETTNKDNVATNQQTLAENPNDKADEIAIANVRKRLEAEMANFEKDSKAAFQEGRFTTFEDKIMNMISERNFKHNLHVNRATAIYIMEKYSLWSCKSSYKESNEKSRVETDILAYLWFSANKTTFEYIAKLFKKPLTQICNSFFSVQKFLIEELSPEVLKFPNSHQEKEAVAKEFEMLAGFPNVLGCFAESFFTVKLAKLAQHCGGCNVYLRGICDAKSKFLYAKTGLPRDTCDTFLEKDLPEFCSSNYHLLGDSKCPIREHLMIPFDNVDNLDEAEKNFNIKLIRTHVKIKKAFGLLRSRFQQLKYLDFRTAETMSQFIVSCCILHNICIDRADSYNDDFFTDVSDRIHGSSLTSIKNDEFLSDLGLMKRFELKHLIFKNKTK